MPAGAEQSTTATYRTKMTHEGCTVTKYKEQICSPLWRKTYHAFFKFSTASGNFHRVSITKSWYPLGIQTYSTQRALGMQRVLGTQIIRAGNWHFWLGFAALWHFWLECAALAQFFHLNLRCDDFKIDTIATTFARSICSHLEQTLTMLYML